MKESLNLMEEEKIKLWKGNRISGEYEMNATDVISKFFESKFYSEEVIIGEQNLFRMFRSFLGSKEGLNSTVESEDIEKLEQLLLLNEARK